MLAIAESGSMKLCAFKISLASKGYKGNFMHDMKKVVFLLFLGIAVLLSGASERERTAKARGVYGRIRVVNHAEDFRVKVVNHAEDLRVRVVEHAANRIGRWMFVTHAEDFRVRFVDHAEDFSIKFVNHAEGI